KESSTATPSMAEPRQQAASCWGSFLPGKVATEESSQPAVRLREVGLQARPGGRGHRGVVLLEDAWVGGELVPVDAEEVEHPAVGLTRLGREFLGEEDEQLVAREDREPPFELLGIPTAGEIGVVPPRVTEVRRL